MDISRALFLRKHPDISGPTLRKEARRGFMERVDQNKAWILFIISTGGQGGVCQKIDPDVVGEKIWNELASAMVSLAAFFHWGQQQ